MVTCVPPAVGPVAGPMPVTAGAETGPVTAILLQEMLWEPMITWQWLDEAATMNELGFGASVPAWLATIGTLNTGYSAPFPLEKICPSVLAPALAICPDWEKSNVPEMMLSLLYGVCRLTEALVCVPLAGEIQLG